MSRCPACGEWIDYCQGHGEIGDPFGYLALELHDNDVHTHCHPYCLTLPDEDDHSQCHANSECEGN